MVADDLRIGKSTLDRWRRNFAEKDLLSGPHEEMSQEPSRLRKENELLRRANDLLKKAMAFLLGRQVDEVCFHRYGKGPQVSIEESMRGGRRRTARLMSENGLKARQKTLKGLTSYEYICKIWASRAQTQFQLNLHH